MQHIIIYTVDESKIEQYKQLVIDEYRKDLEKQHNALTLALDKFNKHNKNIEAFIETSF